MLHKSTAPAANQDMSLRYHFSFGPFQFASALDLPELRRLSQPSDSTALAIQIQLGGVPADIPNAVSFGRHCRLTAERYLLNIAGVADFYVADGARVHLQLAPSAAAADVSTYLLGSIFGVLCHQNGLLPLHASAVYNGGAVTAFLGDSGAGKSTLAACLQDRGHNIISDDICVLAEQPESHAMRVIPVAGWLKLWRASMAHLGETPDERNRVYSADDKYRLYLEEHAHANPVLTSIVFLTRLANAEPTLQPLSTAETIGLMMTHTYLAYVPALTGKQPENFRQCARALEGARGFRLVAPWGFDRLDAVLDLLEREILKRP